MARSKGLPMYAPKTINGSHFLTKEAQRMIQAAEKRTGKSRSDLIEYAIRHALPSLSKAETDEIVEGRENELWKTNGREVTQKSKGRK